MIAKIIKGKGFRGALEYDLREEKGWLLDTNMAGDNPRELATEFGATRALRPNLTNAVCHMSVSIAPNERLSGEQWKDIAHKTLSGMGFGHSQYVVTKHEDTDHPHIHILVSRVDMRGEVVPDSHDYKRMENLMRGFEKEYGLREVAPSREAKRRAPTKGEIESAVRTGRSSAKILLQKNVDEALKNAPEYREFVKRLEKSGVEIIPNIARTGRVSGISFRHDSITMKGSNLGKGYTWGGLQKRGLTYEQGRDTSADGNGREREKADSARAFEGGSRDSRSHPKDAGRIGAITRTVDERHAEITRRYGAPTGRTEKEQHMDKEPARSDIQDMGLLPGEFGSKGRRDTERPNRNVEIRPNPAYENTRGPAAQGKSKQIAPMVAAAPGCGHNLSALERVRALADAGLRYTPKQSEHNLLQNRRDGETSAEPPVERDKVAKPDVKPKKKEQDMEL